ncbi:MAG: deoxyuridine 5'-triphosphate nucleotidohydrolase [Candidatus Omnitrophica bacterium]|nr:deoxyuridine 5'-triphosphate nucleotidohydrolase [Candidatus Omnitrophota bacterium]
MLNKKEIKQLIIEHKLVEGLMDLEKQLTPNGFDITVESISVFEETGAIDFSNKERVVPITKKILPKKIHPQDAYGWWELQRGAYKIKTNETVNLGNNLVAAAFTRTSLLRMGAFTQNGVWDAGFKGKGEFILVVENPRGIKIKQNARLIQMIFFRVDDTEEYQGIYKNLE